MIQTTIANLKPNAIFKFKETSETEYVREPCAWYDGKRVYPYYSCDDVNAEHFATPTRKVFAYEEDLKKK